ncbi:MAG TPA: hypothetical protein VGK29_20970 [Paludibaculum sp.]|jgi:hypothetical protein
MIKQLSSLALAAALAAPIALADRADRADRSRAETERLVTHIPITDEARALVRSQLVRNGPGVRAGKTITRSATTDQQAQQAQAPGVIQVNLFDSARESYFVVTQTIPVGSTIQAFIAQPDFKQEWGLDALRVTGDLLPGYSLTLPGIRTLGDFWQMGLTTYWVVVTDPNGNLSMSNTDFGTQGFYRNASDTSYMVPGINSWLEFTNGSGATIVEIKGRFVTGGRTEVVFEDIVAPQDAIQVIDSSTIQVNLSLVPNFDLTLMKTYLLTVGQAAWTDSFPFRHTPY